MTDQQKAFLELVAGPALEAERWGGIPAAITIAQAILESGWGQSGLFREANNPFGIKASQAPEVYGEYVASTQEFEQDELKTVQAAFAVYRDLAIAFKAHSRLLHGSRYTPVLEAYSDGAGHPAARDLPAPTPQYRRVAAALQACGYATDPDYAEKLCALIEQHHLNDPKILAAFAAPSAEFAGLEMA